MTRRETLEDTLQSRLRRCWLRASKVTFPIAAIIVAAGLIAHSQTPPTVYKVKLEHAWIPMKDGVRLAADLFMPVGGKAGEKFPAVFKYDPYRKDDNIAIIEECNLAKYFVARGYVSACVDIRGTGQSEG